MTKKNRKVKKDKSIENESAEVKAELTETAPAEGEASAPPEESVLDVSADDLLDDVRRSLIEDDAQSDEKKSTWWKRRAKGKRKDASEEVLPVVESAVNVDETPKSEGEYLEQIDELIDLLEPEVEAPKLEAVAEPVVVPPTVEPEPVVDLDELKKRVFSPAEAVEERELSEVRNIALEGSEDVFVEVEAKTADPLDERLQAFKNSLRPYRRAIDFALAFLGVVVAVSVLFMMYTFYQRSLPPEPATEASNLPFPTSMVLPGGLNFNLGKGAINDGEWNPRGPEWLEGTEICRWVAIPWSTQLEAVVRTLTQKDTIDLVMNNADRFTYNVNSIQELTLAQMQELDQNSPCLLLVLAKQDSDKRWVVTAIP